MSGLEDVATGRDAARDGQALGAGVPESAGTAPGAGQAPGAGKAQSAGQAERADPAASIDGAAVRWGPDGLVPAIVVDAGDGAVLMLAWMDAESLAATFATGDVHFHSRSRDRLWRKGETSGNVLRLRSLALDCDGDAVLVVAEPQGPTCHRGTRSCFDPGPGAAASGREGFAWLEELWSTIRSRADERPADSYTVSLLDGGVDVAARKVTEEATEVLIAAKDDAAVGAAVRQRTRRALAEETGDLLYHLLVLLAERDLRPAEVLAVLRERHAG